MPHLNVVEVPLGRSPVTAVIENDGLGPAIDLSFGPYDERIKGLDPSSHESLAHYLRVGKVSHLEGDLHVLANPGVVIRYRSAHGTVIEERFRYRPSWSPMINIKRLREDRPYDTEQVLP